MLPSGEQFELRRGMHRVVVVEVGGGIREWEGVLAGYGEDEMCRKGRGQVLAPWPNRLQDGAYEWDGEQHRLPLNEPPYAIHGLVRWASWRCVERAESRVALEHVLHPQPGYPFALRLRVEYALGGDGLSVRTLAENVGDRAAPFGCGHHPYLAGAAGDEALDETRRWDGRHLAVWADESWPWVQLYAYEGALAVEPMTCPADAFATGEGVIRLEPGDMFEGRWGIDA